MGKGLGVAITLLPLPIKHPLQNTPHSLVSRRVAGAEGADRREGTAPVRR